MILLLLLALVACAGYAAYERAGGSGAGDGRAIGTGDVMRPIGPSCDGGHFESRYEYHAGVAVMRSECVHGAR